MNNLKIWNSTPHDLDFRDENGNTFTIPKRNKADWINAKVSDVLVKKEGGVEFVTPQFEATQEGWDVIRRAESQGYFIVGSLVAAQAYKGRVFGMTPAKNAGRGDYAKSPSKFTTFEV